MKIDKAVFSSSERFSCFWPMISRVYRKMGIEPVCLLYGQKQGMSEEFGRVIEMPVNPNLPLLIQITWSKFWWVTTEPETTWLIGDIDLIPLSTHWFTDNIASVGDQAYVHLDADGITQLAHTPSWCDGKPIADKGCPTNLPGHYHVGKGRILDTGLERHGSLEEELRYIVKSGKFENTRGFREEDPIEQFGLWCAEELRSTRSIRNQMKTGAIHFKPFSLRSGVGHLSGDTLEKDAYDQETGKYMTEPGRVYVDLHAVRPFGPISDDERQKRMCATETILAERGML